MNDSQIVMLCIGSLTLLGITAYIIIKRNTNNHIVEQRPLLSIV